MWGRDLEKSFYLTQKNYYDKIWCKAWNEVLDKRFFSCIVIDVKSDIKLHKYSFFKFSGANVSVRDWRVSEIGRMSEIIGRTSQLLTRLPVCWMSMNIELHFHLFFSGAVKIKFLYSKMFAPDGFNCKFKINKSRVFNVVTCTSLQKTNKGN